MRPSSTINILAVGRSASLKTASWLPNKLALNENADDCNVESVIDVAACDCAKFPERPMELAFEFAATPCACGDSRTSVPLLPNCAAGTALPGGAGTPRSEGLNED